MSIFNKFLSIVCLLFLTVSVLDAQVTIIPDKTANLPPDLIRPSAVFYHGDRLYIGGRTAPAWLMSLRASDLGDPKFIRFPAENHPNSGQAKYNVVLKMQWFKDKLLVLFSGSSQLTIVSVNPITWTWEDVISSTRGNDILSFWADEDIIYAAGYGQDFTIGFGVISLVEPPSQSMKEWLIPNVLSQYAPILGSGRSLYYVNGNMNNMGNFMVVEFNLDNSQNVRTIFTSTEKFQNLGPDMIEYGNHIYLTFLSSFFGSYFGVPSDTILRFNKTSLLMDKLVIDGPSKGVVRGFWADSSYLWIIRSDTLSRYDGNTFVHFNLGSERPELLIGDNTNHLFGIERGTPIAVHRYSITAPKPEPRPALIIDSDTNSIILGDSDGNQWRIPATKVP